LGSCGQSCGECEGGSLCQGGVCTEAATCAYQGLEPTNIEASLKTSDIGSRLRYRASTKQAIQPYERLTIEILQDEEHAGPSIGGWYDLVEHSGPGCSLCVTLDRDCGEEGCNRVFEPISGAIMLDSIGEDGAIRGTITGAVFQEVYVDPQTGESYPLPHGESACLPSYAFDQELNKTVIKGECVAEGTGKGLGQKIANLKLMNCLGEEIDLHGSCGITPAVWFIATASW
jgi:hypothetical protein